MAFKMQCPKCNSTSLFLEEDQKAFVGGGRHQVQLHCYMCGGKVIYGQTAIEAEYNKQMAIWAKANQNEPAIPAASPKPNPANRKRRSLLTTPKAQWRVIPAYPNVRGRSATSLHVPGQNTVPATVRTRTHGRVTASGRTVPKPPKRTFNHRAAISKARYEKWPAAARILFDERARGWVDSSHHH